MKILIFGGTTEGRLLAKTLADPDFPGEGRSMEVTVSVATPMGEEELSGIPCRVLVGRKDRDEIEELTEEFDFVIDATHPYAQVVTKTVQEVCRSKKVPYIRVERPGSDPSESAGSVFSSAQEAADFLRNTEGNILLTTGAKELPCFKGIDAERLFPRVLPTYMGIDACEELGVPHRNIIAMQGPFSKELNEALIRQYKIRWLVTKDGGKQGGFAEKAEAAKSTGAELLVIARPGSDDASEGSSQDENSMSMEKLIDALRGENSLWSSIQRSR